MCLSESSGSLNDCGKSLLCDFLDVPQDTSNKAKDFPNTPFEDVEEDESLETDSIKSVEERGNEGDCDTNTDTPDPSLLKLYNDIHSVLIHRQRTALKQVLRSRESPSRST
jgi:hypothetical protein